jgi:hypothetical protein
MISRFSTKKPPPARRRVCGPQRCAPGGWPRAWGPRRAPERRSPDRRERAGAVRPSKAPHPPRAAPTARAAPGWPCPPPPPAVEEAGRRVCPGNPTPRCLAVALATACRASDARPGATHFPRTPPPRSPPPAAAPRPHLQRGQRGGAVQRAEGAAGELGIVDHLGGGGVRGCGRRVARAWLLGLSRLGVWSPGVAADSVAVPDYPSLSPAPACHRSPRNRASVGAGGAQPPAPPTRFFSSGSAASEARPASVKASGLACCGVGGVEKRRQRAWVCFRHVLCGAVEQRPDEAASHRPPDARPCPAQPPTRALMRSDVSAVSRSSGAQWSSVKP